LIERKVDKTEIDLNDLKDKNEKLVEIRQRKMEGVLLRSRARWVGEGEKITKYFCGLEKRNFVSKQMNKIIAKSGHTLTKTQDIVEETKHFYESLYENRKTEDCNIDEMVNEYPKLTEEEANDLEGKITVEEATHALKKMKNAKSPGSDGFTVEFFKVFWTKRLNNLVVRSINDGFDKGEMSSTQKEGIIICIPKGDKPREYLKNWRPISLLNVVYKIATSCIAERMKTILPKLISEDQSGFMADRYIGNNTRLIYDLINYCNTNKLTGLLLCIDFEKAFDSLDWKFMHKVLKAFGFKNDIRRWINVFYSNTKSTVLINGQSSPWFTIKRGCRQGDPISPYLFILCAEVLAIMIKENKDINGIIIGQMEYKLSQFADDTELFQNGDRKTFEETIRVLEDFGNKSGLKLNIEKTVVVWLGAEKNSDVRYMPHLKFEWNPAKFKILGIWFTNDLASCAQLNFDTKFQEVKSLFIIWLRRLITPLGRVAILKSLILSKLVHLWLLLPDPPDVFMEGLQKMIFRFVWDRKRDRISRNTAVKDITDGGLGIPQIKGFMNALKLTWIRKLQNTNHKWKYIVCQMYQNVDKMDMYGPSVYSKNVHNNTFWKDVFKVYELFRYKIRPDSVEEALAEHLFFNDNIKIEKKYVFFQSWFDRGIYRIGHILDERGQFYKYNEFIKKYDIQVNFLRYLGCETYLNSLKITIDTNETLMSPKSIVKIYAQVKGTKSYYNILIENGKSPNCCSKWETKLEEKIDWKACFSKIKNIKEVKLKWFQIRLLHRILATNVVLKEMGVTQDVLCNFCNQQRDNIQHCMWGCQHIHAFWNELEDFIRVHCDNVHNLKFNEQIILFGTDKNLKSDNVFDFILLCAKFFIYRCKYEKVKPTVSIFRKELKKRYEIEVYNQKLNMTLPVFLSRWAYFRPMITLE
jgi:hypothetical protein